MKLSEIKINPKNPRIIKDDRFKKLVKSVEEFPKMMKLRPIVIDEQGMVLGGNMRLKVLQHLKFKEIPDEWVKRADELTEEEKQRFIVSDNVGFGDWNWDELANEWDAVKLEEWGLELPGDFGVKLEAQEDDYEIPDEIETDIVVGDLFEIGPHRLLCGDSTDSDQVARLMNGEKAELLLTDPPYGLGIDGQKKSIAKNPKHNRKEHEFRGWDNSRPEQETLTYLIKQADMSIIWGGNYFADLLPASRGWLYWSKGQEGLTMSDGELAWTSENKPLRSITINRAELHGSEHPTQKPVRLITFCIEWANNPEKILDAYLGSGTTMVAAHQLNRKCYGMEIDCKYCEVIVNRMLKLDNTLTIKRNGVDETDKWVKKLSE